METTRPPARLVDATRFFSRGDSKRPPATESTLRNEMSALYGSILPMIDERGSAVLHVHGGRHRRRGDDHRVRLGRRRGPA